MLRETIPYLDQYLGVWAIAIERVQPLLSRWEHIQKIGLSAHLSSPEALAAREAGDIVQAEPFTRISGAHELAEISLNGTLMKQASSFDASTSTLRARRAVRAAAASAEVAGILIRIDSPGGTFSGTDDLAADVAQAAKEKPVFAFVEDLGASAAFYIASQATQVFSNRTAAVGSIGTFAVIHDLSGLAANEGVVVHVVRAGKFKGMGVPGTEISEEQLALLQAHVDQANTFFLDAVAAGRGLSRAQVAALADGRLHIGAAAAALKLTDGVRTLDEVVNQLSAAASGGRTPRKGNKMSESTPKTETETPTEPVAATLAELKAALPAADSNFVLDCLEKALTLDAAKTAYIENQTAQLEMRESEIEQLKQAKAKAIAPGVKPLGEDDGASGKKSFDNPAAEFRALIDQKCKDGMNRQRAASVVARENPELREAVIEAANA